MTLVLSWNVDGRRCVVVGGGTVGTRRARDLVGAGARVTVVAPDVTDELVELADLAGSGALELEQVPATRDVLERVFPGAALVVVATDRTEVNELAAAVARDPSMTALRPPIYAAPTRLSVLRQGQTGLRAQGLGE